jgi:hypothetical protein
LTPDDLRLRSKDFAESGKAESVIPIREKRIAHSYPCRESIVCSKPRNMGDVSFIFIFSLASHTKFDAVAGLALLILRRDEPSLWGDIEAAKMATIP